MKRTPLKRGDSELKRTPMPRARSNLRARSKKMQRVYVDRKPLVEEILEARPRCEMRPGCTNPSTCVHERWQRGRSGNTAHAILCPANTVASCWPCNQWASEHNDEAEELGIVIPGWMGCPCGTSETKVVS